MIYIPLLDVAQYLNYKWIFIKVYLSDITLTYLHSQWINVQPKMLEIIVRQNISLLQTFYKPIIDKIHTLILTFLYQF